MQVGQQVGPFAVEKELGQGAMGAVFLAKHLESGKRVAIKVVGPGFTSKKALERFQRESDILKQLKHPNIVRLIAVGKLRGAPFYAMEYIEGESLDHVMARRGRITWEEVVELGKQLCSALQHAHEHGIIHRDLKPSNLMVLANGTVKLTDFGIAKDMDRTQLTADNATVGTASYMSPEQCRGERDLTSKSDLYSMGIMFYELLTGRKPFEAESVVEMFRLHDQGTFVRPSKLVLEIPIWLDTLVCQLMEKDPGKRPLDARTVGLALERVKEKVVAQQSAGMEAAKARKIDRSGLEPRLDETDKEAARTLLHKKKKKKVIPFYRRGWFQVAGLAGILVSIAVVFYLVFLKPPSPESLIGEARALMKTDRRAARKEPIQRFLELYPKHAQAAEVQQWADQIDLEDLDRAMHNRRNREFAIQGSGAQAEKLFRRALDYEEGGMLQEARKAWQEISDYKNAADLDQRAWNLVARKYLDELDAVDTLYKKLQDKVQKQKGEGKKVSEEQSLALKAVQGETDKKTDKARGLWENLKQLTKDKDDSNLRRWFLLAAWRYRELGNK